MPRRSKGIHTSPDNAGVKNIPSDYVDKNQDTESTMAGILPIYKKGMENRENYKGLWDEESLQKSILEYFEFSEVNNVKVAKVGLALWLGISKAQIYEWVANPTKYGFKSDLTRQAFEAIELSYIGRAEKYPTANIFLLKTSHGHIETSKMEVSNANSTTSVDEINDTLSKLGLDK